MKRGKTSKKKIAVPKKKTLDNKQWLTISIAAFLIFAFALAFVNVPQNSSSTGRAIGEESSGKTGILADFFTNWEAGNLDTNIAKYLLFFMLLILITSILNFAKFPEKGFLQFLIALPVAFLASAYLVPAEVLTILQSYETLGIVLSFILPFVILLFFSAMLVTNEKIKHMSMPKIMLEVFLWLFFIVVLGYKIISGLAAGEIPLGLNLPILIMGVIFLASFLIFVLNKKFRNWMWNIGLDIRRAKAKVARAEAVERDKTEMQRAQANE